MQTQPAITVYVRGPIARNSPFTGSLSLRRPSLPKESQCFSLGIIAWIIIGGLAGWIGSKIMKTDAQQGIFLNIVVGVIGGLIGGFLLRVFGVDVEGAGWIFSFLTCLLGAVILLFLVKAVTGKR